MKVAKKHAQDHPVSIRQMLHERLAVSQPGRSKKNVHASDLTREKVPFCPRETVLSRLSKGKPKREYLNTSLNTTFATGRAVQALINDGWLADVMVGDWQCRACGDTAKFVKRPSNHCGRSGITCQWRYEEVRVTDPSSGASGGIDAFVDVGEPRLRMVECKIMDKDMFKALKAPLSEHVVRTRLYLKLISESRADYVNDQVGHILYVCRGYGVKDDQVGDKFSPFKEFVIARHDDAAQREMLSKARLVKHHQETGKVPRGVCPSSMCGRAKQCSVIAECFSGHYPRETTWVTQSGHPAHPEGEVIDVDND